MDIHVSARDTAGIPRRTNQAKSGRKESSRSQKLSVFKAFNL